MSRFLNAIGVYAMPGYRKLTEAPGLTSKFFSRSQLSYLEQHILPTVPLLRKHEIYYCCRSHEEHYYFSQATDQGCIMAVNSGKPLNPEQLVYLFYHIDYAQKQASGVKVTLDDIFLNPTNYINKDVRLEALQHDVDCLTIKSVDNLDKLLERGEEVKKLASRSFKLRGNSEGFLENTEKLNKCCWW